MLPLDVDAEVETFEVMSDKAAEFSGIKDERSRRTLEAYLSRAIVGENRS